MVKRMINAGPIFSRSYQHRYRWLSRLTLVASLSLLTGCNTFLLRSLDEPLEKTDRASKVKALVDDEEFSRARSMVEKLDVNDPDYEALASSRQALGSLIQQFENKYITKVTVLKNKHQWAEALALVDKGLKKLPDSDALSQAKEQLLLEREGYLERVNRDLKRLEGRILPKQLKLMEQRAKAEPDNLLYRWQLYQQRNRASIIARDLLGCVEKAQLQGDTQLAGDCLAVVTSMDQLKQKADRKKLAELKARQHEILADEKAKAQSDVAKIKEKRAVAQKKADKKAEKKAAQKVAHMDKLKKKRVERKERKDKRKLKKLKREYRELVSAGWLLDAKEKMNQIKEQAPENDRQVASWENKLEKVIQSRVKTGIEHGQLLYSQGFLLQALSVWKKVHELAPENSELNAHIARVERFLDNLNRLHDDAG